LVRNKYIPPPKPEPTLLLAILLSLMILGISFLPIRRCLFPTLLCKPITTNLQSVDVIAPF